MNENAIMTTKATTTFNFKSNKLNVATAKIANYITEVQTTAHANHIEISKTLASVATEKLYEEDGFKSAVDYAMTTFGWKKANAYAMIQVGTKLNSGELPLGDFSVSQYREMLPLSKEEAEKAIEDGIISEDMSTKDIRAEVEVLKPKKEKKPKPEKVYKWYAGEVSEHVNCVSMTESEIMEYSIADWTHKVTVKNEVVGEMVGLLICFNGYVAFYIRGEEVKEDDIVEEK